MAVHCRRSGAHVVTLTLDNPARRNALGEAELRSLAALWPELAADAEVRAVVVEGAGDTAFCAGADLAADLTTLADFDELIDAALLKTRFFPKPLLAAIGGACVAGGFELALSCDVRVVAAEARLGLPEVRWGILPSGGATAKLVEQMGHSAAMRLLLSGEPVSGKQAAALGFAALVAGPAEARAEAARVAASIAAASPVAVQATKRAVFEERCRGYAQREANERALAAAVRASGHARIGVAAFLDKRVPHYPG